MLLFQQQMCSNGSLQRQQQFHQQQQQQHSLQPQYSNNSQHSYLPEYLQVVVYFSYPQDDSGLVYDIVYQYFKDPKRA